MPSYPATIPDTFADNERLVDAYRRGWNHGHGLACHNVPRLGDKLRLDDMGRVTVDAENIADVHQSLCFAAELNSRCYSPFEQAAHEFNSAGDEESDGYDSSVDAESLWEAFEAGAADSIMADLATYTDLDYGIEES